MVRYMMVSLANSLILLLIESGMSLMHMRNRKGPKYGSLQHSRQHWAGTRLFAVEDHTL